MLVTKSRHYSEESRSQSRQCGLPTLSVRLGSAARDRELKIKGAYSISCKSQWVSTPELAWHPRVGMTLPNVRDSGAFSLVLLRKTSIPKIASWVQRGCWTKCAGRRMAKQNATYLIKFKFQVDSEFF